MPRHESGGGSCRGIGVFGGRACGTHLPAICPAAGIRHAWGEFEEGTGALALRARFVNTDNLLRHGSSGRIKIKRSFPGALLVPQKSVMEIQDKDYVFTVDANNMVVMQSFVPLQRFQDYYIVRQGLEKGQRIVYEGVENLREGMIVRPLAISVDEAYKSLKQ